MDDANGGNFRSARHHVVCKRGRERLPLLVVGNLFIERRADALRDAALHLPVDDHRVDHGAAVLGHHVVEQLGHAALGVDRDDDRVRAIGEDAAGIGRLIAGNGLEQRVHAGRQLIWPRIGGKRDFGDADLAGRTMHHPVFDAGVGQRRPAADARRSA